MPCHSNHLLYFALPYRSQLCATAWDAVWHFLILVNTSSIVWSKVLFRMCLLVFVTFTEENIAASLERMCGAIQRQISVRWKINSVRGILSFPVEFQVPSLNDSRCFHIETTKNWTSWNCSSRDVGAERFHEESNSSYYEIATSSPDLIKLSKYRPKHGWMPTSLVVSFIPVKNQKFALVELSLQELLHTSRDG